MRRQPEGVVGVARNDVVALRVEYIQIQVPGRRQSPFDVARRVLGEFDLKRRTGERRGVVVLVFDRHQDADVLAAQRDRHQRVGRAQFPVQHNFGSDLARRLFDVQIRVDRAARHWNDQIGRRRGSRHTRVALADQTDCRPDRHAFRDFKLSDVFAAAHCQTGKGQSHEKQHPTARRPRRCWATTPAINAGQCRESSSTTFSPMRSPRLGWDCTGRWNLKRPERRNVH